MAKKKANWRNRIVGRGMEEPKALLANPFNWRRHTESQNNAMRGILGRVGWVQDVIVNKRNGHIVDGHMRNALALEAGEKVPVKYVDLSIAEEKLILATFDPIGDMAERDAASLDSLLDQLSKTDADFADLIHHIEAENKALTQEPGTLAEKFLVPPFSVLDARQGYWQERKRAWLSLGIKSEEGRPENLLQFSDTVSFGGKKNRDMTEEYEGGDAWANSGTSIFDPVLCELVYRWFLPPSGGSVLDPFAGGSVRGVVAAKLGHRYTGVELRTEQVLANRKQAEQLKCDTAEWIQGDSNSEVKKLKKHYDLLFSCPPYFDLEKYSDDPNDLSNAKSYEKFFETYFSIIDDCCNQLIPEAFACFVVSDIRDPGGVYRGFVADTIRAFKTCGMDLYNDAVLVQPVGTLPLRISKSFGKYRKLGRVHKNVLVFHRGNPKGIVDLLGEASYSPDDWMELFGIPAGAEEAEA